MPQLVMRWNNDGAQRQPLRIPEGVEVRTLAQLTDSVAVWCSVARYLQPEGYPELTDAALFEAALHSRKNFREDTTVVLLLDGVAAATATVLCDPETREGYVHMVACRPDCRGRGLGHLLSEIAVDILKREQMQTAYLTTDAWRMAAIKTYLKVGFYPDLEAEPEAKQRWEPVLAKLQ